MIRRAAIALTLGLALLVDPAPAGAQEPEAPLPAFIPPVTDADREAAFPTSTGTPPTTTTSTFSCCSISSNGRCGAGSMASDGTRRAGSGAIGTACGSAPKGSALATA